MVNVHPSARDQVQSDHVQFRNVVKSYDGETLVVKDLNLSVARGEFLTLLGPSGSGKTTSLMMLAGFEQPTGGEIFLNGTEIGRMPANKRGIGMVFQSYALFPHMTVEENLAFPLEIRGLAKHDVAARVARILDMVKLPNVGGRKPSQLSGGQQQRIALARALVFEPELVLMDEPLGALDKQLRDHMQQEIRALHDRLGVTMISVTHDQGEALTMSDRVAVFDAGRIQQLATPRDLYESPANAFVASFIGENNQLVGETVEWDRSFCRIRLPDGQILAGRSGDVERNGEAAVLSIRPERVIIGENTADGGIALSGECVGAIYHGDHIRVRMRLHSSEEVVAKVPNSGANRIPSFGQNIAFGWSKEDAVVLRRA